MKLVVLSFDLASCRLGVAIYSATSETMIARAHVPHAKLITPSAALETASVWDSIFLINLPYKEWYHGQHLNLETDPSVLNIPDDVYTISIWNTFYKWLGVSDDVDIVLDLYLTITPPCRVNEPEE